VSRLWDVLKALLLELCERPSVFAQLTGQCDVYASGNER